MNPLELEDFIVSKGFKTIEEVQREYKKLTYGHKSLNRFSVCCAYARLGSQNDELTRYAIADEGGEV